MEINEQVNALTGGGAAPDNGVGEDWKAKYEALQREYASAKVEQGRVKKLDERAKELEAELKALKSGKSKEELLASVSDETRENVAPEVQVAAAEIAAAALERERAANEERFREYDRRFAASAEASAESNQRAFMARIETTFPGFLSSVGPGGNNAEAWTKYLVYNKGSVAGALQHGDFGTIDYHIRQFCASIEVPVPSADGGSAIASDPGNQAGGAGIVTHKPGKTYSYQEWSALPDLAEQARDRGDYAEMKRIYAEYEKAPSENRVK